ncbi:unnamed protein product [Alopecurus aequalis]
MEGSFLACSFQLPAATCATGRYAPWVLLDSRAYFAVRENATTAETVTSTGRTIKVTFCLADPPAISRFWVHGPDFQRDDFTTEPLVLFSAKDLVLLRFSFTVGPRSTRRDVRLAEYFVYKAGHGKPPSLTPIPHTPPGTINTFHICILPLDDDDDDKGGFLLADLFMTKLHVFSSKTARWTTTPLQLPISPGVTEDDLPGRFLDKVIVLGGGAVGWVDLCRGIVSCNVFDKNPVLTFIPIPECCKAQIRTRGPRHVRDVTFCNGYFKFVELDLRSKNKSHEMTDESSMLYDGWELQTWYRHTSWYYWHKGHTVDTDDISADNLDSGTGLPLWLWCQLTPTLWDAQAGRWALGNMISGYPILGIDGGDVVYIMSKVTFGDKNSWMVGVDLAKKTVDVIVPISPERVCFFNPKFITCEFSEYLNASPRSSTDLVNRAPNGFQNYHLSSDCITEGNLPPQQGKNSYYNGSSYANLSSRPSSGNAQSTDPVAVVNTDAQHLPIPLEPTRLCGSTHLYRLF